MVSDAKRAYMLEYRSRPGVRERINAQQREYYRTHGGRERLREKYSDPDVRRRHQKYMRDRYRSPEAKAKILAYQKERNKRPEIKKRRRELNLMRLYGLSEQGFVSLLETQGGKCAICGTAEWGSRGPVVDHSHASGKVRGALCAQCNVAVGMIEGRPEAIEGLRKYLTRG